MSAESVSLELQNDELGQIVLGSGRASAPRRGPAAGLATLRPSPATRIVDLEVCVRCTLAVPGESGVSGPQSLFHPGVSWCGK